MKDLSFEDLVCWAFDTVPSRLGVVYFTHSFRDVKCKIRIRTSFEQVKVSASFQVMSEILSAAFGGGDSKKQEPAKSSQPKDPNVNVMTPKSVREAKAMLSMVLNGR